MRRIGIMTSGGDCPGLNAVIRSAVKTAYEVYGAEVVGIHDGFLGLLPTGVTRTLSIKDVRGVLSQGGTILGTTNEGPFNLGPDSKPLDEARATFESAAKQYRRLKLEALIVVGGDGSMRIARALSDFGVNLVGVPKTIDNDVEATERTFGFDTAVEIACQALDRLRTVAAAHHRIMVCEVMGREAGWIALHAGLASGADAILIPEIPFSWEPLVKMVDERRARESQYSLIVVAEGATIVDSGPVWQADGQLGGIGLVVSNELAQRAGVMTRVTVLGHVQRGGTPTANDRVLASRFGETATHLVARGTYGQMVALHADDLIGLQGNHLLVVSPSHKVGGGLAKP
ncbi:MAG: ATP-dependent 6-phosphofructokinase [Dehalococcoidia bacterium]|nr:ATP-dependent 6-phosphofructokinase [Dehalococcoidia bacterium]